MDNHKLVMILVLTQFCVSPKITLKKAKNKKKTDNLANKKKSRSFKHMKEKKTEILENIKKPNVPKIEGQSRFKIKVNDYRVNFHKN
jgi:hypothetical protein